MTHRLGTWVEQGELHNQSRNSVVGTFKLLGRDEVIRVDLVGNLPAPLTGKSIIFESASPPAVGEGDASLVETLQWNQFGPIVAFGFRPMRPADSQNTDEPASLVLGDKVLANQSAKQSLYIEWFGPDGQIVIEVIDPVFEIHDEIK